MGETTTRARVVLAAAIASVAVTSAPRAEAAGPGAPQCVAASENAIQLRKDLKLRAAQKELSICVSRSCPTEVREECERRIGEISAAIPTVVFEIKTSSGNDVIGATVTMDGVVLAERIDGTALSVDPGEHELVFTAPDLAPLKKTFVMREGQKNRREIVVLAPSTPSSGPAATPIAPIVRDEAGPSATSSWSAQKTFAVVVGGVGIVGVAAGSFFGLRASSRWSQAKSDCPGACAADSPAQGEKNDAHSDATLSTIAFGVGAAALVGATLLWLTAPSAIAPTASTPRVSVVPSVGPGRGDLILRGAF